MHGTVIERVEGRLLDVSARGCRLETTTSLTVGSVCVLEARDLAPPVAEVARVCHTLDRPGAAARYVVRLEFLPLEFDKRAPASVAVCSPGTQLSNRGLPVVGERSESATTKVLRIDRSRSERNTTAGENAQE